MNDQDIDMTTEDVEKVTTQTSKTESQVNRSASSHKCGLCEMTFTSVVQYLLHKIDKHTTDQKTIVCELCGIAYSRPNALNDHYRRKHKVNFTWNQPKETSQVKHVKTAPIKQITQNPDKKCEKDPKTVHIVITKADSENEIPSADVTEENFDQTEEIVDELNPENTETLNESVEQSDADLTSNELKEAESWDSEKLEEEEDFHFILVKHPIIGSSFNYSKTRFQCLHCDFKTYWRTTMCTHMKSDHKDMMSIHQFIEIKPPEIEMDNKLDQTIMKMSKYVETMMDRRKKTQQCRTRKVEKQDLLGNFPCTECDKEFNRLRYLRKHMLVHKGEKKYLCDECGKAFKTRSYLKAHHRSHKDKYFKCNQCDFTSSVNAVIHAHRQLHNDGSVICDVCGFAYADKSTLKKHKLVHDPNRPFPCTFPGCTWRFKSKTMCHAHHKAHTSEGKFRCSVCGYVFRQKHHLQRHQSKMHGITNMSNVTIIEDKKDESQEIKTEETSEVPDTVNLIVNDMSRDQLQTALQNGQLVIATDSEGNTINYEVADITMNVTYHTLLEDESDLGDTQTILHVATIDSQEDPSS